MTIVVAVLAAPFLLVALGAYAMLLRSWFMFGRTLHRAGWPLAWAFVDAFPIAVTERAREWLR